MVAWMVGCRIMHSIFNGRRLITGSVFSGFPGRLPGSYLCVRAFAGPGFDPSLLRPRAAATEAIGEDGGGAGRNIIVADYSLACHFL
jgi:hypothetical protein